MTEVCAQRASGMLRTIVPSRLEPNRERLDSWKEIAVYLEREVRTVQRWEKHEDLPVRRQFHRKGCTVYALKSEIDSWLASRSQASSKPRPRRLRHPAIRLDPSPEVTGQMLAVFRLCLAIIERGSEAAIGEKILVP